MIFGIGTDVVQSCRIDRLYARYGERFARRVLMPVEMEAYARARSPARFLAMHFAAKEAIVKALGTGFAHGIWVRDVGFVADRRGKPLVVYSPRGDAVRQRLGAGTGHVSLTDEAGLVVAFAVLEKADGSSTTST